MAQSETRRVRHLRGEMADRHVDCDSATRRIRTARLLLRPWALDDLASAYDIYGAPQVSRWLCPALAPVANANDLRPLLAAWISESDATEVPLGRWAIVDQRSGEIVGGVALLSLPPRCNDLEIAWQISPTWWGQGYGAEAGHAVAHQAFDNIGISELFAVIRPGNHRGVATARRVGMDWVGETNKYYGLHLQVYRLKKADLDLPEPACAPAP
jgi:RimJ/RimL family protein N-acetyltransferase